MTEENNLYRKKKKPSKLAVILLVISLVVAPIQVARAFDCGPFDLIKDKIDGILSTITGQGIPVVDYGNNFLDLLANTMRSSGMAAVSMHMASILYWYETINLQLPGMFLLVSEAKEMGTDLIISKIYGSTAYDQKFADYMANIGVLNKILEKRLEDTAKTAVPNLKHLCNLHWLNKAPTLAEEFQNAVSVKIQNSMARVDVGPDSDYSGPEGTAYWKKVEEERGYGFAVDGDDLSALNKTKVGPFGIPIATASFRPVFDGSTPMQIPKIVGGQPDPKTPEEELWVAQYYYCQRLEGVRVTPVWGKNMETMAGSENQAAFREFVAKQSPLNAACADMLALHTRPNPDDMPDNVNKQKAICEAAKPFLDPNEMKARFEDCSTGLSAYELGYLSASACMSKYHYAARAENGTEYNNLVKEALPCSVVWNQFQMKLDRLYNNFMEATIGQRRLRQISFMQRN